MDVNKYLIIIKNEDKTEDIINYENNRNLINVKYRKITNVKFYYYFWRINGYNLQKLVNMA